MLDNMSISVPRPEDVFIHLARFIGTHISPPLQPLKFAIAQSFGWLFPSLTLYWRSELVPLQSPLVKNLPMVSPSDAGSAVLLYLVAIGVGVAVMKRFKPIAVNRFSLWYNLMMTVLSAYICSATLAEAYRSGYTLYANHIDHSSAGMAMAKLFWLYYFSRLFIFTDTAIMVLKKNNHQISFMHLFHHATVILAFWFCFVIAPNGEMYTIVSQNTFSHVLQYGYYALSALGFKHVWVIKKYLMPIEIAQFGLCVIQCILDMNSYPRSGYDGYPRPMMVFCGCYLSAMGLIFLQVYISNLVNANHNVAVRLPKKHRE